MERAVVHEESMRGVARGSVGGKKMASKRRACEPQAGQPRRNHDDLHPRHAEARDWREEPTRRVKPRKPEDTTKPR